LIETIQTCQGLRSRKQLMGKRAELTIRETVTVRGVKTVGMMRSLISSELSIMAQGINDLIDEQPSPLKSDI